MRAGVSVPREPEGLSVAANFEHELLGRGPVVSNSPVGVAFDVPAVERGAHKVHALCHKVRSAPLFRLHSRCDWVCPAGPILAKMRLLSHCIR